MPRALRDALHYLRNLLTWPFSFTHGRTLLYDVMSIKVGDKLLALLYDNS